MARSWHFDDQLQIKYDFSVTEPCIRAAVLLNLLNLLGK